MKRGVDLGGLYLSFGTYAVIARAVLRSTQAGIQEVTADPLNPIRFRPVVRDPKGLVER